MSCAFILLKSASTVKVLGALFFLPALFIIIRIISSIFDQIEKSKKRAEERRINEAIRMGRLVRCSDGVARPSGEAPIWEKRNSRNYSYLVRANQYNPEYLDTLSIKQIENLCDDFKKKEEKEKVELEAKRKKEKEEQEVMDRLWRNPLNHILFEINEENEFKGVAGVYMIYNNTESKFYIGSSVNMLKRKKQHLRQLRNNQHHTYSLQNAFNQYSEADFKFYAMSIFEVKDLVMDTARLSLEEQNKLYYNHKNKQKNDLMKMEQVAIERFSPTYNVFKNVFDYREKYGKRRNY